MIIFKEDKYDIDQNKEKSKRLFAKNSFCIHDVYK